MVFDPTLPADSTKLRLAPGVIQANWAAIEDAETSFKPIAINLNNRTPLVPSNDPAAITDAYLLYCKDVTAANAELFGIKEDGTIVQFTTIPVATSGTNYSTNLPSGIQFRMGQVAHTGTSTAVVFGTAFTNAVYSVVLTPIGGAAAITQWNAQGLITTGFTLASTGTGAAESFQYMAIGR